jgi:hypothetical protein
MELLRNLQMNTVGNVWIYSVIINNGIVLSSRNVVSDLISDWRIMITVRIVFWYSSGIYYGCANDKFATIFWLKNFCHDFLRTTVISCPYVKITVCPWTKCISEIRLISKQWINYRHLFNCINYEESNGAAIVNNELGRMWKGDFRTHVKYYLIISLEGLRKITK